MNQGHYNITTEQVLLVRKTWRIFRGIDPAIVGDTFYSKLFAENPSIRRMFPDNMDAHYRKLIAMLNTIIVNLDKLNELRDDISALARRFSDRGLGASHYKLAGETLLWTLRQGMGKDWTPAIGKAWTDCYTKVVAIMITAVLPCR